MSLDDDQWEELLTSIDEGWCTPFIGPEAYTLGVPIVKDMATKWAHDYHYPLEDSPELAKVAQFLAIDKGDNMYPKKGISKVLREINPPDFSSEENRNTPYAFLADLNLPIYITTNYDYFMEAALKKRGGKDPVSEFCIWNEELYDLVKDVKPISIFDKEEYTPSPTHPLVYHLYGVHRISREYYPYYQEKRDIDIPQSMVLTEKDYIDFVISLNRRDEKTSLPTVIRTAITTTPWLFLGYSLQDIGFRVIFQGVTSFLKVERPNISIAVQLPPNFSEEKMDKVQKYLEQYTKNMYKINVYWKKTDTFVKELRERLDKFRTARSKK
jgi:hypothetical protein